MMTCFAAVIGQILKPPLLLQPELGGWTRLPINWVFIRKADSEAPQRLEPDPLIPAIRTGDPLDLLPSYYPEGALVREVEVIGPVTAELHVRSTLENTDFFVRLCDVEPSGASRNICDGLVRLVPNRWRRGADGVAAVEVSLWPAAHVFRRGHRMRVQVSSGAHPRFARNLGGGEPIATAVTMHVADQEVWHDPDHRSAIVLPVRDPG